MQSNNLQDVYKVILVGDQSVGKSSILMRYTQNIFRREYTVTIGLEFASKKIMVQDSSLTLQIWDTAGQEAFRSIVRSFYRNSAAIIIVYKVTCRDTFDSVKSWINEIQENGDEGVLLKKIEEQQLLREKHQLRVIMLYSLRHQLKMESIQMIYSKKPLKKYIKIQEHKAPMFVILWCLEANQSPKKMKLFNNTFHQRKKKKKDVVENIINSFRYQYKMLIVATMIFPLNYLLIFHQFPTIHIPNQRTMPALNSNAPIFFQNCLLLYQFIRWLQRLVINSQLFRTMKTSNCIISMLNMFENKFLMISMYFFFLQNNLCIVLQPSFRNPQKQSANILTQQVSYHNSKYLIILYVLVAYHIKKIYQLKKQKKDLLGLEPRS